MNVLFSAGNDLVRLVAGRRWLTAAVSITLIAVIACGADSGTGAVAPEKDQLPAQPGAPQGVDAAGATVGDSPAPAVDTARQPTDGISPECVRRVLGRDAAGFGDVTAAERDLIFSECAGGTEGGVGPRGGPGAAGGRGEFPFAGGGLAALDPGCVKGVTGNDATDFTQITPEQRQRIFQECGAGTAPAGDGGTGRSRGGFLGPDGPAGQLPECVSGALGRTPGDLQNLTREDFQAIASACGNQFGGLRGSGGGGFFGQGDNPDGSQNP